MYQQLLAFELNLNEFHTWPDFDCRNSYCTCTSLMNLPITNNTFPTTWHIMSLQSVSEDRCGVSLARSRSLSLSLCHIICSSLSALWLFYFDWVTFLLLLDAFLLSSEFILSDPQLVFIHFALSSIFIISANEIEISNIKQTNNVWHFPLSPFVVAWYSSIVIQPIASPWKLLHSHI